MKETRQRKLAAIMFTDIVGYSAAMQSSESAARKLRSKHRKIFEEQHAIYAGEIIQYYGDGTLSIFKSAVHASKCALAMQQILRAGERVPVRIGIHLGDIVYDQTEVYGDGVNIASRIEQHGVAGSVLISSKVNDEIKNQEELNTVSLGRFDLKNIAEATEVFALDDPKIEVPQRKQPLAKSEAARTSVEEECECNQGTEFTYYSVNYPEAPVYNVANQSNRIESIMSYEFCCPTGTGQQQHFAFGHYSVGLRA